MAYIGHLCGCGHMDIHHGILQSGERGSCSAKAGVGCGNGCSKNEQAIQRPTFDTKGRPVERIIPPGDGLRSVGDAVIVRTCDCEACQALYAEITAA